MALTVFEVGSFFFLMIRRPPRSTLDRSSAASDVYKRQVAVDHVAVEGHHGGAGPGAVEVDRPREVVDHHVAVSYTHLRAHETVLDIVCRLLLEKKNKYHHARPHLS